MTPHEQKLFDDAIARAKSWHDHGRFYIRVGRLRPGFKPGVYTAFENARAELRRARIFRSDTNAR